jgi:hypothetical protein
VGTRGFEYAGKAKPAKKIIFHFFAMTKEEVLARYAAGERAFPEADLTDADLSGAIGL